MRANVCHALRGGRPPCGVTPSPAGVLPCAGCGPFSFHVCSGLLSLACEHNQLARAQLKVMIVMSARPFEEYFENVPNVRLKIVVMTWVPFAEN